MEALNLSPEKMKRVPQLLETFSDSMLKVVQNGITDKDQGPQREAKQGLFEEIYRELTNRGYRFNEKDHAKAVQGFANDRNNRLADMLPSMRGVFRDLFASADVHKIFQQNVSDDDKKIQREKAAQLTADTRTTADVFSDAFSSLFNTISEPLEMIVKLLSFNLPGFFERNKWSSDSTKRVTGDLDRAGITDRAFESAQAALDRMRYDAMNENDPARKGALNTRIEKTRRQLSDARGTLATYHQGKGVLDSDLQSANAFIKQFGGFDHAASPDELAAFSRSIGLSKNSDGSWSGVVSDAAEKDLQDIFKQLKGFGQVKVSQQPSANGKGDTWNVVTNYHSENVDQMPPQTSSLRDSGERPKVPTKAGQ
jgi:hypothetical protein